jgi:hypothetical protein
LKPRELPPQVGFNNNVKHRGLVFHIQTEDSGIHHPHINTHLFVDGGRIIKSQRLDYSYLLGAGDFTAALRALMKEQHKAMYVALRSGGFDALLTDLPLAPIAEGGNSVKRAPVIAEVGVGADAEILSLRARELEADSLVSLAPSTLDSLITDAISATPITSPPRALRRPPATFDALGVVVPLDSDLGFGIPPEAPPAPALIQLPPMSRIESAPASSDRPSTPGSSGRFRAPRPAAIFSASVGDSLFGGQATQESSIDDVILSYLSGSSELDSE